MEEGSGIFFWILLFWTWGHLDPCSATTSTLIPILRYMNIHAHGLHPALSEYKAATARARCQARCYKEYGLLKPSDHYKLFKLYQPIDCGVDVALCQQCSEGCNTHFTNLSDCHNTCSSDVCTESCLFLNSTLLEESRFAGKIMASNLPQQCTNVNVTHPELVCFEASVRHPSEDDVGASMKVKWNVLSGSGEVSSCRFGFLVEIQNRSQSQWSVLGITSFAVIVVENLAVGGEYRFRIHVLDQSGFVSKEVVSDWIRTPKVSVPLPPENITVRQYVVGTDFRAELQWAVPNNVGCHFVVSYFSGIKSVYRAKEHRDIVGYKYEISGLLFDSFYHVNIRTTDRNLEASSGLVNLTFASLQCLNVTNYNYSHCAPGPIRDLKAQLHEPYEINGSYFTDITLTWRPPVHGDRDKQIEKYEVRWMKNPSVQIADLVPADRRYNIVNAEKTNCRISRFPLNTHYVFYVKAISLGGQGLESLVDIWTVFKSPQDTENSELSLAELVLCVTIIPVSLAITGVALCVIYYKRLRKKVKRVAIRDLNKRLGFRDPGLRVSIGNSLRREETNPFYIRTNSAEGGDVQPLLATDEYEIDFESLKIFTTLGEGAFGKVLKAELLPTERNSSRFGSEPRTVAVKMLKEHATPEERRFLLLEISAMKQLGHHPHIVTILACVTTINTPCLIMDYCPLGDLRNYLRQHRIQVRYIPDTSLITASTPARAIAPLDHKDASQFDHSSVISQTTLLSYARQIALGMEYLHQNRFIHRDLACRNILVSSHTTVKISDFGLSRDVYETNAYQPTSARKLPFKWMPIESIFDQIFTIKSDVWSYGILLWEIVTMGGCPYPGVPNNDLFRLLSEGYRLERPVNCSLDIYKIMLSCWHPRLDDRPTFTQLKLKIESLLEATCSYIDLAVEVSSDYYTNDSSDDRNNERKEREKSPDPSAENYFLELPFANKSSLDLSDSASRSRDSIRPMRRYPSSKLHDSFAMVCAHYPVSKGPYVVDTNGPVPGLSEELLQTSLSSPGTCSSLGRDTSTGTCSSQGRDTSTGTYSSQTRDTSAGTCSSKGRNSRSTEFHDTTKQDFTENMEISPDDTPTAGSVTIPGVNLHATPPTQDSEINLRVNMDNRPTPRSDTNLRVNILKFDSLRELCSRHTLGNSLNANHHSGLGNGLNFKHHSARNLDTSRQKVDLFGLQCVFTAKSDLTLLVSDRSNEKGAY
ncbi:uncharacterized protein LOC131935210 [Physella acuta]|uniref:uncharacterized protein LOC131935210 n=1 Tax=Physella acuta TaxID=109671 RepID=UPI0027DCB0D6|nr:uncharacterized protein LOC131935210 [Physella acuta]XP_059147567.1 uncharacterized protein LOC131935210 [Physella acuta]XP_059147568.1 uncharacterized protein LOC131935210 [Physella acuta]